MAFTLPPHLRKLVDTPAKRAKLDNIIKEAALEQDKEMKAKGYYRKGNKYLKYKN